MIQVSDNLAIRIRDNLFTEEEKGLLEYQCGSLHVDIKDQFLVYYGKKYCINDEQDTFYKFAVIKEEKGKAILEKLRVYKERLRDLVDADNYRFITKKDSDVSGSMSSESENNTSNEHIASGVTYTDSESLSKQGSIALDSALEGANSQLIEGDPIKDSNVLCETKTKLNKKTINIKRNDGEITDVDLGESEISIGAECAPRALEVPQKKFGRITRHGNSAQANTLNEEYTNDFNWSKTKGKGASKSSAHNIHNRKFDTLKKEYIEGDNLMKVLEQEIPQIRSDFWNLFSCLFKHRW